MHNSDLSQCMLGFPLVLLPETPPEVEETSGLSRATQSRPLTALPCFSPGAEQAADGPRLLGLAAPARPPEPRAGRAAARRHLLLLPAPGRRAQPAREERAFGAALLLGLPLPPRSRGDGEADRVGAVRGCGCGRAVRHQRAPCARSKARGTGLADSPESGRRRCGAFALRSAAWPG